MECMKRLKLSHRPTFRANYLNPALSAGLIEQTIPDKPNSRLQIIPRCEVNVENVQTLEIGKLDIRGNAGDDPQIVKIGWGRSGRKIECMNSSLGWYFKRLLTDRPWTFRCLSDGL